ncbi:extracellular calcium-sensing receptor-like [Solea senegalensis]|uniref:Extracellular calcium-sensing receptor-like n=1 Tax=Solea senegalensis TaxID=28829 RepID=A0AAV6QPQ6_SOLSE|nr:extracellular calcium-sensing receptor-like [Solea senegalensis]
MTSLALYSLLYSISVLTLTDSSLSSITTAAPPATSKCTLLNSFQPGFVVQGDYVIGGIFPLHFNLKMPDHNDTYRPPPINCNGHRLFPRAFRWAQTMRLAVEEINQNPVLLPNHTLGYKIFDSCRYPLTGQRAVLSMLNGVNEENSSMCTNASSLLAVIGASGSAQSIVVSKILQPFRISMISYASSCACLSDRQKYPTFFRVIPSDDYQVKAIAQLLVHFNWTWVGLLRGDNDYGRFAAKGLLRELQETKVCVAYQEIIPLLYNRQTGVRIMKVMRSSTAKVVVVFAAEGDMTPFLREYMTQNITGIQWVASEAWVTASVFSGREYYPYLGGTIGFGVRKGHISRLGDFLQTVNPMRYPGNVLVHELWESLYGCSPFPSSVTQMPPCSGQESLLEQHSAYMNTSSPRIAYNVYKSVYAIAHSLHDLLLCQPGRGPFQNNSCAQSNNIHPWQLQHYLQEVNFQIAGEEVDFDAKGDSVPYYDIINWQRGPAGNTEFVNVGLFDGTKAVGEELLIQEDGIMWAGHQSEVPVSVCSASCLPGFRKAVRRGEPICCFDCVPCDSGKISNQTRQETLLEQHSAYMNTSSPRVAYNVYKAVYAIAHSLHNLLLCKPGRGPFQNNSCAQSNNIHPWQLQHYLQEVNFQIAGEEVDFDAKGDSVPYYDIINWQRGPAGNIEFVNVGLFDGTKAVGEELLIQEDGIMCQYLFAVPVVFQASGRLSVVGSLSAALTVYHVTVAKLAIRQVSLI